MPCRHLLARYVLRVVQRGAVPMMAYDSISYSRILRFEGVCLLL